MARVTHAGGGSSHYNGSVNIACFQGFVVPESFTYFLKTISSSQEKKKLSNAHEQTILNKNHDHQSVNHDRLWS